MFKHLKIDLLLPSLSASAGAAAARKSTTGSSCWWFYRNFISYRWVAKKMVVRMQRQLTAEATASLNQRFADILVSGEIVQGTALPEEKNEPELAQYPRLILTPHQHNFGRLREFIDAVND